MEGSIKRSLAIVLLLGLRVGSSAKERPVSDFLSSSATGVRRWDTP